jgi:hypothetical protein
MKKQADPRAKKSAIQRCRVIRLILAHRGLLIQPKDAQSEAVAPFSNATASVTRRRRT